MFMYSVSGIPVKSRVELMCDCCGAVFVRTINQALTSRKRRGENEDYCNKCSRLRGATKRPQNSKEFWNKCKASAEYVEKYRRGIACRPSVKGESNPMWGKTFSDEAKRKRSEIWKSRTGTRATNWKGGKQSLTRRVKAALQRKHRWFHRVIERDKACRHCSEVGVQLDAHHIIPINTIIKQLLTSHSFETDDQKFEWLTEQPEIIDNELQNGIALCRQCHKHVHTNWGSHEPKVHK